MALSEAAKQFLLKKEISPLALPPKETTSESVAQMRERLEIRRLQIELEKLEKPDTSIDYYSKMLELQKEAFANQIQMLREQQNLKIEIEKLKLVGEQGGGDFAEDFLYQLMPLLPQIIAKNREKGDGVKGGEVKQDEMTKLTNGKEFEEYKLKIKAGIINEQMAWEEFQKNMPEYKDLVTREQFMAEFNKIKNG